MFVRNPPQYSTVKSHSNTRLRSHLEANAYVSGMKEELNVVGNEYQTFTTMWTM